MTQKADFNAEEWTTVVDAPMYAAMRVISADRGGTIRETVAMSRVYQETRAQHGANDLLDALVSSPPSIDPQRLGQAAQNVASVTRDEIGKAVRLLQAKATPSEVDDYKRFVMTLAQTIAAAHKEGGILGIGGKPVSDAENEALDEISSALGSPPTS